MSTSLNIKGSNNKRTVKTVLTLQSTAYDRMGVLVNLHSALGTLNAHDLYGNTEI